jgi:glycosyltransferase involved in cell wall biosynthesis
LKQTNEINIYDFTSSIKENDDLIPENLIQASLDIISNQAYQCFIGIERMGLIWAGKINERLRIPVIYYSLELFTTDSPYFSGARFMLSKELERKYHRLAVATIIQDEERARVLFTDNQIDKTELLLVPVSVLGGPNKISSSYLRDNYSIAHHAKIILVFGEIWDFTICTELVTTVQDFPDDWVLVMHHSGSPQYLKVIENLDLNKRIIPSLQYVPPEQIQNLISSADIGLALYGKKSINEYLTGSASEKLALYLQSGLPVITMDYPSFKNIIERFHCGICISSLQQLKKALETIISSINEYRESAFDCFSEHYEFKKQFLKVIDFIESLS